MKNNELALDQIPQGVINDIHKYYKKVELLLDGKIDMNTVTRKSNYIHNLKDTAEPRTLIDAITFETKEITGILAMTYVIRGNINEEDQSIKVHSILESGAVLIK